MTLSAQDKKGLWLIGGVGAFLVAIFTVKVWLDSGEKVGLDGCRLVTRRNTVVLLDYSDSTSRQTRDEIEARAMEWVADSVQEGERVSVFTANAESIDSLRPVFSRCRPPADGSATISNVRAIRLAFDTAFNSPLRAILGAPVGSSAKSPLAQVLIDLSLTRFMRTDTTALLVFSDLLEHNPPRFSIYSCSTPERVVADFRASRAGMKERPEFRNLRVMLHVIPRGGLSGTIVKCRDALWMWFFGDNRGAASRLEPAFLPGGPTT